MKKINLQFSSLALLTWLVLSCNKTENLFTVNSPNESNSVEFEDLWVIISNFQTKSKSYYIISSNNDTTIFLSKNK